jgi:hypothetical protein
MKQFIKKNIVYIYSVVLLVVFSLYQFFQLLEKYFGSINSGLQVQTINPEVVLVNGISLLLLILLFYTLPLMIYINTNVSLRTQRPVFPYSYLLVIYRCITKYIIQQRVNRPTVLRC